jgi:molybdenum cofactor cytidylyltransferase
VVSAVVLAAGASTRMGSHKLLLSLGGEPIVRRTVRQIGEAGFADVLVVLGRDAEAVRAALDGLACRFVLNEAYESGMGSSFRTAVDALGDSEAAVFALADQPFVTADDYRRVRDGLEGDAAIVCAQFGDVTAPPHLFTRELFEELRTLKEGARPVLTRHAARARTVHLPADHLVDIDTPDDYARAQELAGGPAREDRRG